jgi:hypothetical protein
MYKDYFIMPNLVCGKMHRGVVVFANKTAKLCLYNSTSKDVPIVNVKNDMRLAYLLHSTYKGESVFNFNETFVVWDKTVSERNLKRLGATSVYNIRHLQSIRMDGAVKKILYDSRYSAIPLVKIQEQGLFSSHRKEWVFFTYLRHIISIISTLFLTWLI